MKRTKNLILGVLSCLLLSVGFAQVTSTDTSRKPVAGPGDDGPPAYVVNFSGETSRKPAPGPGDDGPPVFVAGFSSDTSRKPVAGPGDDGPPANLAVIA